MNEIKSVYSNCYIPLIQKLEETKKKNLRPSAIELGFMRVYEGFRRIYEVFEFLGHGELDCIEECV